LAESGWSGQKKKWQQRGRRGDVGDTREAYVHAKCHWAGMKGYGRKRKRSILIRKFQEGKKSATKKKVQKEKKSLRSQKTNHTH